MTETSVCCGPSKGMASARFLLPMPQSRRTPASSYQTSLEDLHAKVDDSVVKSSPPRSAPPAVALSQRVDLTVKRDTERGQRDQVS